MSSSLSRRPHAHVLPQSASAAGCGSPSLWREILEINLLTDRSNGVALATALRLHPRESGIAAHRVLIHLGERQAAWARQSAFRERLLYSVGKPCKHQQQSDANLLAAIELTGRADLLTHLHPSLLQRLEASTILHANLAMQLASIASPAYGQRVEELAKSYPNRDSLPARAHRSKLRVGLIGLGLLLQGPVAHVLHAQGRGDHQHLIERAALVRFQQHAAHARVQWQAREGLTDGGEFIGLVHRAELCQQLVAVGDGALLRRLDEGKGRDLAQFLKEALLAAGLAGAATERFCRWV